MAKKKTAAKKKHAKRVDSPIYVRVDSSHEVRKSALGVSRDTLLMLKQLERLLMIREQKKRASEDFFAAVDSIGADIKALRTTLPDVPVKYERERESIEPEKRGEEHPIKTNSAIHSLENELLDIENKIKSLN